MRYVFLIMFVAVGVFAYPIIEEVGDTVINVGDSLYFEVRGESWYSNYLIFEANGAPEEAVLTQLGFVGGCTCSRSIWGAGFSFVADTAHAGNHYIIEFVCIDTLGETDVDTMNLRIVAIPPVILPLPDVEIDQHDTHSVNLRDYVHDPDGEFGTITFETYHSGIYDVWITEDAFLKVANPDAVFEPDDIVLMAMDEDSACAYDTFTIVFNFVDDPPEIIGLPSYFEIPSDDVLVLELEDYAYDPDTPLDMLSWSVYSEALVSVVFSERHIAEITPTADGGGFDTVYFVLIDTSYNADTAEVVFYVHPLMVKETALPKELIVGQPTPNPFNNGTTVDISAMGAVNAEIYDVYGNVVYSYGIVRDIIHWDGRNSDGYEMPSGIYKLVIKSGSETIHRRMVYIK